LYGTGLKDPVSSPNTNPVLDEETVSAYTEKLLVFMKDEQAFLNPGLSLRGLAEQVEIHPNQLSWLLNQQLKQNFNEFINHHRVEHFKKLARDPANAHISLIGLAYESGFNSKTVFNTCFKKETGMTPSQYLKA
jgi:AraC-like DNA-binding protein